MIGVGEIEVNFGNCIPGSVHEKRFTVMLKKSLAQVQVVSMIISCDDSKLNDLPEYIFGIRKENSFEYFDEFKFKASQKGMYTFVIGVKTPLFLNYEVSAKMEIYIENSPKPLTITLKQTTKVP